MFEMKSKYYEKVIWHLSLHFVLQVAFYVKVEE